MILGSFLRVVHPRLLSYYLVGARPGISLVLHGTPLSRWRSTHINIAALSERFIAAEVSAVLWRRPAAKNRRTSCDRGPFSLSLCLRFPFLCFVFSQTSLLLCFFPLYSLSSLTLKTYFLDRGFLRGSPGCFVHFFLSASLRLSRRC